MSRWQATGMYLRRSRTELARAAACIARTSATTSRESICSTCQSPRLPSLAAEQDHRDVVGAAAVERGEHEVVDAFLRREVLARQHARDDGVVDFLGEAVGAEHHLVARLERARDRLDTEALRVRHAERLRHDVAVRVRAGLLRADRTLL